MNSVLATIIIVGTLVFLGYAGYVTFREGDLQLGICVTASLVCLAWACFQGWKRGIGG